ncbi:type III-B CRISPR module RAMP protein Cmr1 [Oceanithermus sp.]
MRTFGLGVRTITPVFGGSAVPGEVNRENPVRAPEIRGQLRFWWRATAGARYKNSTELFKAEEDIWGSAERPSQVSVRIVEQRYGEQITAKQLGPDKEQARKEGLLEAYLAYPFRGNVTGLASVAFELQIGVLSPELEAEVITALRAWLLFGGIGARTRRGLGALDVLENENRSHWLPKNPDTVPGWLNLPSADGTREWPLLAGAKLVVGPDLNSQVNTKRKPGKDQKQVLEAWRELGRFWARFRKGHVGPGVSYRPTGRSLWGDYETLKKLKGKEKRVALAKPFLGLPIVYQSFRGKAAFSGTLEAAAEGGARMASPVIIKPISFANGEVRPAVLLLSTPAPARLRISGSKHADGSYDLEKPGADPVLRNLGAATPLEAVLKAAKELGWEEVPL